MTGLRFQILLNGDGFKTALPNVTIVSLVASSSSILYTHRDGSGKKLKKRLEDLERKAATSSAPTEQRPPELQR